ncbi:MAG: sigma-70 family RNA polymerase sigma factor [Terracidiphilus sp.]
MPDTLLDRLNIEEEDAGNLLRGDFRGTDGVARDADLLALTSTERRAQLLWDVQRVTKSSEEAEDIVQEALLRAWRSLQQFRGDAQISTWLRAIVRNTAREWLRNRGSRVNVPIGVMHADEDEFPVLELTDSRPDPEETCARREMAQLLRGEIEALTMISRRAIEMCALEEQSLRSAAQALNVNVVTVKSRLFRGRQLLRQSLCERTGGREHCHVP